MLGVSLPGHGGDLHARTRRALPARMRMALPARTRRALPVLAGRAFASPGGEGLWLPSCSLSWGLPGWRVLVRSAVARCWLNRLEVFFLVSGRVSPLAGSADPACRCVFHVGSSRRGVFVSPCPPSSPPSHIFRLTRLLILAGLLGGSVCQCAGSTPWMGEPTGWPCWSRMLVCAWSRLRAGVFSYRRTLLHPRHLTFTKASRPPLASFSCRCNGRWSVSLFVGHPASWLR